MHLKFESNNEEELPTYYCRGTVIIMKYKNNMHLIWLVDAVTALPGIGYLFRDPIGIFDY